MTGLELYNEVMSGFGFCHRTQRWLPGLMAEATTIQVQEEVSKMLQNHGLRPDEAEYIIQRAWSSASRSASGDEKMVGQPEVVFQTLKKNGIKVAICTADSRESTMQLVRKAGLEQYVDMMVCGDDENSEPKPSPYNAYRICNMLNVDPERAVVVGDTIADMEMGRSAQVGTVVGVLSGVGQQKDLQKVADYVVPDIRELIPIFLPDPQT